MHVSHTDRGLLWILLDYEPKLLDLVEPSVVKIDGNTFGPGRLVLYSTILLILVIATLKCVKNGTHIGDDILLAWTGLTDDSL